MPFRDVIGHRRLVGLLARSVPRQSLPPSLILAGPAGIGKRLVATALAQAVNCLRPQPWSGHATVAADGSAVEAGDACGACPACARIARGVFPDVIVVEPGESGSIKVDQVRDVVDRAGYRPFEGRRRVVIIDGADALIPAAQNALLKTLEEPPSSSMFLLLTSRPDALLPTVQSRCPRLRFWPLGPDEVAAVLVRQGRSETEARALGTTSDGSVGRALEAGDDEVSGVREAAARALLHAAVTTHPRQRLEGAKDLIGKGSGQGASERAHLAAELRAMASLLRDVELVAAGGDRASLANPDLLSAIERLTAFQGRRGVSAFDAVDQALVAVDRSANVNANAKIVADWLMLRL